MDNVNVSPESALNKTLILLFQSCELLSVRIFERREFLITQKFFILIREFVSSTCSPVVNWSALHVEKISYDHQMFCCYQMQLLPRFVFCIAHIHDFFFDKE